MRYNQTMRSLTWSTSHAVFVKEIDDEHKEIFEALCKVQKVLASRGLPPEVRKLTSRLISCIVGHFAHEERLMRAARYASMRWHKKQHDNAARRVQQLVNRLEQGDLQAGLEMVQYLTSWLHDHTRLSDQMLGAFLRNEQRFLCTLTLRAGTKPINACAWVRANGDTFGPQTSESRS